MRKEKRVLITGITGFVGSHLADYLLSNTSYHLFGLKRVNSSLRNIQHLQEKVTLINADVIDQTSLVHALQKVKPDYVYHLAALSWVTPSWDMPAAYMQVNAIGTINLFEALRVTKQTPRIFVSCTPEEFGDVKQKDLPITEKTPIAPINPYAASKVAQDVVCQTYHASYGFEIIRTRAFNHEGSRRDILGALASFAYQIARIERGLQKPVISVGNLEARRNFTDVRDMVAAYFLAMEKGVPGELYLLGSNQVYTMQECLAMLIRLSSSKKAITWKVDPNRVRPTELRTFIGNFDKFESLTGWKPKIPLKETMQSILDYWREFIDKGRY